jgi:hypothetical protein
VADVDESLVQVTCIRAWLQHGIIVEYVLHDDVRLNIDVRLGLYLWLNSVFGACLVLLRVIV